MLCQSASIPPQSSRDYKYFEHEALGSRDAACFQLVTNANSRPLAQSFVLNWLQMLPYRSHPEMMLRCCQKLRPKAVLKAAPKTAPKGCAQKLRPKLRKALRGDPAVLTLRLESLRTQAPGAGGSVPRHAAGQVTTDTIGQCS
jgi:hypothetical protein